MDALKKPFAGGYELTQTFAEHVANAANYAPGTYNGGMDWALPLGTPVLAAADGRVVQIGNSSDGYGLYVKIAHTECYTLYAHLQAATVAANAWIYQGQGVGASGSSGNSTGPHLHFEVRTMNGQPIDPAPLLVTATVRPVQEAAMYETLGNLNIRYKPNLYPATVCGLLPPRWQFEASGVLEAAGVVWLMVVGGYYVALQKGGDVLCKKVL